MSGDDQGANARVAVITGGASGIGLACARRLAELGARVCLCDLDEAKAREAAAGIEGATAWQLDVRDRARVDEVFERIGREVGPVEILVTAAGIPGHGALAELGDELWDRVIDVNLTGVMSCMRAALRQMLPRRTGSIVNIASICGMMGCASAPAYSAAKAGVIGLTKACARRHTAQGVRINAVAPGLVDTPFIEPDRAMGKLEAGIAKVPLGRMGRPEEIADLVAWLCGETAGYVVGQVISPNGGQVI